MSRTMWFRRRPERTGPRPRLRLEVERLEDRNLLSSSSFVLTPLVQVSNSSPSLSPPPASPVVFPNSEVEPQLAVNPADTTQAVAVWQQDRYRSGGGSRALFVSVTANGNDATGATWSAPAAIPGFDATAAGAAYGRYTDPWVSIGPDGKVYATALAIDIPAGFPSTSASLVITGSITVTNGVAGISWDPNGPTTLIRNQAPPGTDPIDLANDKEMVVADPKIAGSAYVIWDRLDHPSDQQNFNAFHGVPFREDALFSRTTDGGAHWDTTRDLTNFQANQSAFGNEIVVEPNGTLVDVFTYANGSGKQGPQAGQNVVGVMRSTDHGLTWSDISTGPAIEVMPVTDPDTGAAVRDGEPLTSVSVDPTNGNLYAVWADGRFSDFAHDDIAFSMSTDGGLTWSDPIKINQTPTNIPAGDQQAFTPTVAVNSAGTVAVGYYDFRNNTAAAGLPTDYWLVHAGSHLTNPASWASDEKPMTDTSFNMENAAPTSRGYFLGDYQGLASAGTSFYSLFAQAGSGASDPSDIWFRDPPAAAGGGGDGAAAGTGAEAGTPSSLAPAVGPQGPVGGDPTDVLAPVGAEFGSSAARFLLSPSDMESFSAPTGEYATAATETEAGRPSATTSEDGAVAHSVAPRHAAQDLSSSGASGATSVDEGDDLLNAPPADADAF